MLELNDYKDIIQLSYQEKSGIKLSKDKKEKIVDKLLQIVKQNFFVNIDFCANYTKKRLLLRALLNQIPPFKFDGQFFELQDKLLSAETYEKNIVNVDDLQFQDNVAIFQGDITSLSTDAIVNAGNNQLLGCFIPLHSCIDNIIISAGGFQIRNDLYAIMQKQGHDEPNGKAKITSAYNLPSKYIIHTVGPCIYANLTSKDKQDLENCYKSSLNLAKEMNLKSIAFCCISTGEFRFPNDIACEIAVNTVKKWLKDNDCDIKVVFDVFKNIDKELYERKLQK